MDASFFARIVGVMFSPRAAYAAVVVRPRAFGVLALVLVVSIASSSLFFSTEVGRESALDQEVRAAEAVGREISDQTYARMQALMPDAPYLSAAYVLVFFPLSALVVSGIVMGAFKLTASGGATFKQVFAVVAHSLVILGLQQLFIYPVDYLKQSLSSPTSVAVFLPFLDDSSFPGRIASSIDLMLVWWLMNLAVGLSVLYRRRTGPIALTMVGLYAALALVFAAIRTVLAA